MEKAETQLVTHSIFASAGGGWEAAIRKCCHSSIPGRLAGSNDIENAEIAGIIDVLNDFMLGLVPLFKEEDEERDAQTIEKIEEDVPKYWGVIEGYYKKNNSADGWIYGDKPTYADFSI